jgi:hypothetical protein
MAYNDCLHKTELAAQAHAASLVASLAFNSFTGLDSDTKALPSITFMGEVSEPVLEGDIMANRLVTLAIAIRTNADDTTPAIHRGHVQEFLDLFYTDTLAADLNGIVDDFACMAYENLGEQQEAVDRSHVTTARLRLHVGPSDIA